MKKALITGVNGQDGAYLAQLLLSKGYEVHGLLRRSSVRTTNRFDKLDINKDDIIFHQGDLSDGSALISLVSEILPDEIYNLGAMSHVATSFKSPESTACVDGLGVVRLLEAVRINAKIKKIKFYQASTSELYGKVVEVPQKETTPFYPRSPYAVAKLYGYWITKNYRESYNLFACNGILFNHESPVRGEDFVTRKITLATAKIKLGMQSELRIGNIEAKRDWGYAKEYVEGMWRILQADEPDDFVLATGETTSIRDFIEMSFAAVDIKIKWEGEKGTVNEVGVDSKTGKKLIVIDPAFFRPAEVELLIGDASKAKEVLGWEAKIKIQELTKMMVESDLADLQK